MLSVGAILSSPVVVEDVIYIGSSDGNLYALM
jgi:outer membrane protein assembly factor BamB